MKRLTSKEIARGRALLNEAIPGSSSNPPPSAYTKRPEYADHIKRALADRAPAEPGSAQGHRTTSVRSATMTICNCPEGFCLNSEASPIDAICAADADQVDVEMWLLGEDPEGAPAPGDSAYLAWVGLTNDVSSAIAKVQPLSLGVRDEIALSLWRLGYRPPSPAAVNLEHWLRNSAYAPAPIRPDGAA